MNQGKYGKNTLLILQEFLMFKKLIDLILRKTPIAFNEVSEVNKTAFIDRDFENRYYPIHNALGAFPEKEQEYNFLVEAKESIIKGMIYHLPEKAPHLNLDDISYKNQQLTNYFASVVLLRLGNLFHFCAGKIENQDELDLQKFKVQAAWDLFPPEEVTKSKVRELLEISEELYSIVKNEIEENTMELE